MVIRTAGRAQLKLPRVIGEGVNFIAAVTAGNHFHADAATLLEFTDESAQPSCSEPVTCRMRNHRLTTRGSDPTQRLLQRRPFAADIARRAVSQKTFERITVITGMTLIHQEAREMRAADPGTARMTARPGKRGCDTVLEQTSIDFRGTPIAILGQTFEPGLQMGVIRINTEPEDVQSRAAPTYRHFHAGDQIKPNLGGRHGGIGITLSRIVIGERQHINAVRMGPPDQVHGRQSAIRSSGMAM